MQIIKFCQYYTPDSVYGIFNEDIRLEIYPLQIREQGIIEENINL
jgi:hypothetical protein